MKWLAASYSWPGGSKAASKYSVSGFPVLCGRYMKRRAAPIFYCNIMCKHFVYIHSVLLLQKVHVIARADIVAGGWEIANHFFAIANMPGICLQSLWWCVFHAGVYSVQQRFMHLRQFNCTEWMEGGGGWEGYRWDWVSEWGWSERAEFMMRNISH